MLDHSGVLVDTKIRKRAITAMSNPAARSSKLSMTLNKPGVQQYEVSQKGNQNYINQISYAWQSPKSKAQHSNLEKVVDSIYD